MLSAIKSFLVKVSNNTESIILQLKPFQYDIFLGLCIFLIIWKVGNFLKNLRRNLPPGPVGLPIVGYLPFLSENMHLDLIKLGKKYGDVFSVRLGMRNIVVLHGPEAIREAFNKPEFLGRPNDHTLAFVLPSSAFFAGDFNLWKEQRRSVIHSMKDLGLGRTKIEEDVLDEINHFLEMLKSYDGKPVDVKSYLSSSTSNNISALVFGKRFDYDHPDRRSLDDDLDEANEALRQTSLNTLIPWIKYIPFHQKFLMVDTVIKICNRIKLYIKKEIEKHEKSLDPSNIRDFIDSYLVEMKSKQENGLNTTFNVKMLTSNVFDLFSAGSETIRTSILWFIYSMAAFPKVQEKVQEEIFELIGTERSPEYSDMRRMPYTHAVIMEIMRWKTIVPLNLMRCTVADTKVGGYEIPKGTTVVANFWNAHHDPRYWTEPDVFKPERFLSEDGKSVKKSNNFMPFSLGTRVCPGESMANMEMFLYFTSMLQKFNILFPDGFKPTFDAKLKVTFRLEPFCVKFIPKN